MHSFTGGALADRGSVTDVENERKLFCFKEI